VALVDSSGTPQLVVKVAGDQARIFGVEGEARGEAARLDASGLNLLKERLLHWNRWFRVLDVVNANVALDVVLEVPKRELRAGDKLEIVLRNKTPRRRFFSLLDLAKDGSINVVPLSGQAYKQIEANGHHRETFDAVLEGVDTCFFDILKLIVTDEAVDFSGLQMGAVRDPGKPVSPLEELMVGGRQIKPVKLDAWTTRESLVKIAREGDSQCFQP
jgi:hypothetical protein